MSRIRTTLAVLGVMVLGACSQNGIFPNGSPQGPGVGAGGDPASAGYFQNAVGDRVLFPVDQHTLTAQAQTALGAQATWLTTNAGFTAIVEGHADEQGTREYNLALGARRATAARDYLVSRGVAPNRLRTVTFGKERPIEICSDEACYSNNRRAVTVLQGAAGS
ncbi:MAG: peptidoglycan-associated lipoprotein [Sulfitobacter sp.]|jgi:peptidoglycan-associated lipoprotein